MNNYLRPPLTPEEQKKEDERKKIELTRRMYPPVLRKLVKKPTEKEVNIDRAKPQNQRKFYPFTWEVTHELIYKTENEIRRIAGLEVIEEKPIIKNEVFPDTAVPVIEVTKAKNTPAKQTEKTASRVWGILRWAWRVAKAAAWKIIRKKR